MLPLNSSSPQIVTTQKCGAKEILATASDWRQTVFLCLFIVGLQLKSPLCKKKNPENVVLWLTRTDYIDIHVCVCIKSTSCGNCLYNWQCVAVVAFFLFFNFRLHSVYFHDSLYCSCVESISYLKMANMQTTVVADVWGGNTLTLKLWSPLFTKAYTHLDPGVTIPLVAAGIYMIKQLVWSVY